MAVFLKVSTCIVTVVLFLVAGIFMVPVSLRDEVLLVRGFVCTGTGFIARLPEVRGHGRLELCKGTWSLRGPRWMAMARASLVCLLGLATAVNVQRASSFQLLREGHRGDMRMGVF